MAIMDEEVYGISFIMQRPVVKKLSETGESNMFEYKAKLSYSYRHNGNASGTITLTATDGVRLIVVRTWELYPVISFDCDWGGQSFSLSARKQGETDAVRIEYRDGVSIYKRGPDSVASGIYNVLLKYCSLCDYLSSDHFSMSQKIKKLEDAIEIIRYKQHISFDEMKQFHKELLSFSNDMSLLIDRIRKPEIASSIAEMLRDLNFKMKSIPPVFFECSELEKKAQDKIND